MNQLDLCDKALLELVKIGIGTSKGDFDFTVLTEDEWESVMNKSSSQAVTLLAFNASKEVMNLLPKSVREQWLVKAVRYISNNQAVLRAQNKLVELLEENRLSYIILKGFAAAAYYPNFDKRAFGDVDFLIDPSEQQKVENLLISKGYKCHLEEHEFHKVFIRAHERLEMHFEPAGIPYGKSGEIFRDYLKDAVHKYFSNEKPEFRNPNPNIHAVIIMLHTIHHMFDEGLGLRHLCDWACFVNKTYQQSFWQEEVLPLLSKTGTLKFAAAITKTCNLYLGTDCPKWAQDTDDGLCYGIITDILDLGNFGRGNKTRSVSGRMITRHGKKGIENRKTQYLLSKIDGLVQGTKQNVKFKVAVPFVIVWELIKTAFAMLFGKRISVLKTNTYANERKAIYEQFELYKTEEK